MAIIIPSKNIYEMNNPKIRDNLIDNVSVDVTNAKLLYKYNENIKTIEVTNGFQDNTAQTGFDEKNTLGVVSKAYGWLSTNYLTYEIKIPKHEGNLLIAKIYQGLNSAKERNISHSVNYSVTTVKYTGTNLFENGIIENKVEISRTETNAQGVIDKPYLNVYEEVVNFDFDFGNLGQYVAANVVLEEDDKTNLSEVNIQYDKNTDTYYFYATILASFSKKAHYFADGYAFGVNITSVPKSISITLKGDTITLDLSDGNITESSGTKPFSLSRNELLQDSAKTNGKATSEFLASNILSQYSKGKETAELLVQMGDYYDENDNLVISANSYNLFTTQWKITEKQFFDIKLLSSNSFSVEYLKKTENQNAIGLVRFSSGEKLSKGTYTISFNSTIIGTQPYSRVNEMFVYNKTKSNEIIQIYKLGGDQQNQSHNFTFYLNENSEISIYFTCVVGSEQILVSDFFAQFDKFMISFGNKKSYTPYRMHFENYDEVIPMVFGANGQDRPMSLTPQNNPKVFTVIDNKIIYDGAIWQELILLEKNS